MSSAPKRLCIISANADADQVNELVKRLRPFEAQSTLVMWRLAAVEPGANLEESLQSFLSQADCVLVWISPDLWDNGELYPLFKQFSNLLPPHATVIPVIARHTVWESDDFLKKYASHKIPADGLPMPTDSAERRDAWMKLTADTIAIKLGLATRKRLKIRPFWVAWRSCASIISILVGIVALYLAYPSFVNDSRQNEEYEAVKKDRRPSLNLGCNFPGNFDSTHLYIVITRFEDYANENETECYGRGIESRIDEIKIRDTLPIEICYVDERSPNQIKEAANLRDSLNADIIIWGKLHDAKPDCHADGFCLKFQPSKTLISYAGGQIPAKLDNEYQANVSARDLEEGLISMGKESFDAWVISMSNLKIGRKKPEFYRISPDWPIERQAAEYAERGNMFFQLGLYEKTVQDYNQAIKLRPSFVFYAYRGAAYAKLGQFQLAISDCEKAIQRDSNFVNAYFTRGLAALNLGMNEAAIADYNKVIRLDSNDANAYCNRGGAKYNLGMFESAISDYDKSIKLDSTLAKAYNNRGAAKNKLGQYEAAIADFDKSIQLDPNDVTTYYNRGSVNRNFKQLKAAIADFDKAIQLDSNNATAYNLRGASKYDLGLYEETIADLDKCIQLDSNDSGVYSVRGYSKSKLGRDQEAIADFDKAIRLNPNNADSYENRGGVKSKLGRYADAIADFDTAIWLNPKESVYYFVRGIAKNGLGWYKPALEDFSTVVQLQPDANIHVDRGIAKKGLGHYKEAIADFNKAIQFNPDDLEAYKNRGDTYWEQGAYTAAISDFCQAFRLQYLPGWRFYVAWISIIGLLAFWWFKKRGKAFIQKRRQVTGKKITRQIRRQRERKKKK